MRHRIAVIGGDGIGPEVTAEALKVVAGGRRRRSTPTSSTSAARATCATARSCPTTTLDELRALRRHPARRRRDAGGAAGRDRAGPAAEDALRARPLRQPAPVRRARTHDFVVIRENTEGPYVGEGGVLRRGTPHEVATQGSVNTRMGVERCVRYAFELASHRAPPPPDAGAQDQRAHVRRRPLAAHVRRGGGRVPRRSPPPTTTSTRRRSTSSRTRSATT